MAKISCVLASALSLHVETQHIVNRAFAPRRIVFQKPDDGRGLRGRRPGDLLGPRDITP